MKREDVKNKITGITEEQPNWLMQENGSDITREKFLSTLSLRRATTCYCSGSLICNFYPRSPCGERRARGHRGWHHPKRFLSTLSLRRATLGAHSPLEDLCYFYPRSPCGERHDAVAPVGVAGNISIHALLAESDAARPLT